MNTAILVDGGFYRRRAYSIWGDKTPEKRAEELHTYCLKHTKYRTEPKDNLYRIFYYDCPPVEKKVFHPLLQKQIDLKQESTYLWMMDFLTFLKTKRKVAVRLGKLADKQAEFMLRKDALKALCNGKRNLEDLNENDFSLHIEQKGVDMKIGLDIASMAYKKQVDRIILISGDSDFVPAAKMARREGIDFILDPMRGTIKEDLMEHIDGVRTFVKNPAN